MSDVRSGPDWAEYDPASAPQVLIADAPEVAQAVVVPLNNLTTRRDANANGSIVKSTDGTSDGNSPPSLTLVQRLRPHWRVLVLAAGLLLLALVLAIAIPLAQRNANHREPSNTPSTSPSSTSSVSSTATATSSTNTNVPSASPCDSSKVVRDVDWIGIDNGRDWKYRLKPAKSPEDCCNICYYSISEGCNGWLFVKSDTNTPNCNIIYGYSGPNKSAACPAGKPDLVYNTGEGQGGDGPCAG